MKDLLRRMLVTDPLKRFSAHQVIRHPWTLYGAAADARGNKNNKAKKEGGREGGGKPPAFQPKAKGGEFLENPQESSGYRSKARSSSGGGNGTPTSSNGTGLLRSTMAGQQHVQQPYCPQAAAGSNGTHAFHPSPPLFLLSFFPLFLLPLPWYVDGRSHGDQPRRKHPTRPLFP